MLPLILTLKNFMSYGDEPTTLDFRGMDIICLSGDNGHGKSAILDAITYSLWGETRLGKQGHEQLIRLGADEMAVVFDFALGSTTYRVTRQRSRKSSGQVWEILAFEDDGALRPLTGVSKSDTGNVITRLLRMNYETFLNSTYLKQGRADEFMRQPPMRRKDILGEILDLSRYDELEALARQKMREADERRIDAERALRLINEIANELPDVSSSFEVAKSAIEMLESRSKDLTNSIETQSLKLALIDNARRELKENSSRLERTQSQFSELGKSVIMEQETLKSTAEITDKRDLIETDYARLQATNILIETVTSECENLGKLEAEISKIEQSVGNQRREYEFHISSLTTELTKSKSQLLEFESLQSEMQKIAEVDQELASAKSSVDEFSVRLEIAKSHREDLKSQYRFIQEKLKTLDERMQRLANQTETCSVCGSPLSNERIQEISEECDRDQLQLTQTASELRHQGIAAKNTIAQIELEIKSIQSTVSDLESKKSNVVLLEHRLSSLTAIQLMLPELEREITNATNFLSGDEFARSEKEELTTLRRNITPLHDSPQRLRSARELARTLQPCLQLHARLMSAEREHQSAQLRLDSIQKQISDLRGEQQNLSQSIQDGQNIQIEFESLSKLVAAQKSELTEINSQIYSQQKEKGRLEVRLEQIANAIRDKSERTVQLHIAQREYQLYSELAGAFGKRGVQALIIDNAMPELENDASELLQKLSDGAMNLSVQTQRASKTKSNSDEPIETLDIIVRDDLGERALEIYSGGESFRVSFALRIALSKLLARRAGADLQALVIDEGFGSQDASGREKLVDAIMAIRSDFAQIIVITHIDELKDAFANRIEITKTSTGSQANLVVGAALG